jgi:hypothetical protein
MNILTRTNPASELNWTTQISEGGFTSDDLINAYIKGVEDHAKKAKKDLEKRFANNLTYAQNLCADFIESMIEKGFEIKYARLRFNTIESFKIILFVSKRLFLSDKILELYNNLSSLLSKSNSEKFHMSFNIMPDNKKLNEKRILSDGFIFTYGKQQ